MLRLATEPKPDQDDRADVGLAGLESGPLVQESGHTLAHDLQRWCQHCGLRRQQQSKWNRQRQDPLAYQPRGNDVIDPAGSSLHHEPGTARSEEPASGHRYSDGAGFVRTPAPGLAGGIDATGRDATATQRDEVVTADHGHRRQPLRRCAVA